MSCWIGVFEPKTLKEAILPIKEMNDEIIAYQNGLKVDPESIRYTLNAVYQEDESCLFCKAKEEGEYYIFYGTYGSLFDELLEDLDSGICSVCNDLFDDQSFSIEIKPFRCELIFKLRIKYYDALYFFKKKTEEAIKSHREWMGEYIDMYF